MKSLTLVFDLDDTLVKEIDFLKSAFKDIALFLEPCNENLFEEMFHLYLQNKNVFEFLSQKYTIEIQFLKNKYRNHLPEFANKNDVRNLLETFKNLGCKLGLITDGYSITQRNKLKALHIETIFDLIIISEEFGSEKPNHKNFETFHQFKTDGYFYIGDNVSKDFVTPNQLGWTTICLLDDGKNIHKQYFNKEMLYLPTKYIKNLSELNLIIK